MYRADSVNTITKGFLCKIKKNMITLLALKTSHNLDEKKKISEPIFREYPTAVCEKLGDVTILRGMKIRNIIRTIKVSH